MPRSDCVRQQAPELVVSKPKLETTGAMGELLQSVRVCDWSHWRTGAGFESHLFDEDSGRQWVGLNAVGSTITRPFTVKPKLAILCAQSGRMKAARALGALHAIGAPVGDGVHGGALTGRNLFKFPPGNGEDFPIRPSQRFPRSSSRICEITSFGSP